MAGELTGVNNSLNMKQGEHDGSVVNVQALFANGEVREFQASYLEQAQLDGNEGSLPSDRPTASHAFAIRQKLIHKFK